MNPATGKRSLGISIGAAAAAAAILCSACHRVVPGKVIARDLSLAESFIIENCTSDYFTAFTLDKDLWIIGKDQMIRHFPTGRLDVLKIPVDPMGIKVRVGPGRFCVLEPGVGRIRGFDGDGRVLWSTEGLGALHDVVWTGDRVYVLAYPDPLTGPHVITVVLQTISLADGRLTSHRVELPQGVHWEDFASPNNRSSANLMKVGTTVCVSCVAYEDATGYDVPFLAVPAEQGGFRAVLRGWIISAAVAGDTLASLIWQNQWVLTAYDLRSGEVLWKLYEDSAFGSSEVFVTVAGDVIVLCDGVGNSNRARGLDPRSGDVIWTTDLPAMANESSVLTHDVVVACGDRVLRLSPTGKIKWVIGLAGAVEVISLDELRDQLDMVVNPPVGVEEVKIRLSDGAVVEHACGQASFRYLAQNHPVPLVERTAGDSWEVLLYLEGRCAHVADPIYRKQDSGIFARMEFVVTACTVGPGQVRFYILRPKGGLQ